MELWVLVIPLIVLGGAVLLTGRSFYSGRRGAAEGQWGSGGGSRGGGGISPPMLFVPVLVLFVLALLGVAVIVAR